MHRLAVGGDDLGQQRSDVQFLVRHRVQAGTRLRCGVGDLAALVVGAVLVAKGLQVAIALMRRLADEQGRVDAPRQREAHRHVTAHAQCHSVADQFAELADPLGIFDLLGRATRLGCGRQGPKGLMLHPSNRVDGDGVSAGYLLNTLQTRAAVVIHPPLCQAFAQALQIGTQFDQPRGANGAGLGRQDHPVVALPKIHGLDTQPVASPKE